MLGQILSSGYQLKAVFALCFRWVLEDHLGVRFKAISLHVELWRRVLPRLEEHQEWILFAHKRHEVVWVGLVFLESSLVQELKDLRKLVWTKRAGLHVDLCLQLGLCYLHDAYLGVDGVSNDLSDFSWHHLLDLEDLTEVLCEVVEAEVLVCVKLLLTVHRLVNHAVEHTPQLLALLDGYLSVFCLHHLCFWFSFAAPKSLICYQSVVKVQNFRYLKSYIDSWWR